MSVEASVQQRQSLQFNPEFHRNEARRINSIVSIEEYFQKKEQFLEYIPFNVETALGERFNVSLSTYEYDIDDGMIYGRGIEEAAINSFKRGRDFRRRTGNPVDHAREDAEIEGFEKIQAYLTDPLTKVGSMMLSVSPKGKEGSSYGHNFYDVFILKETKSGKRYIEARRYASGLNIDEYTSILMPFGVQVDRQNPDVSLLKEPIKIPPMLTPDDLHKYLHKDKDFMSEEKFAVVRKHTEALRREFAQSLLDNPDNNSEHERVYNAILNKADEISELLDKEGVDVWSKITPIQNRWAIRQDIENYSKKEVREVITGCGVSAGLGNGKEKSSPFSVSEFGKNWDYHKGDCVNCKTRYTQVGPCNICKDCEKEFDEEE